MPPGQPSRQIASNGYVVLVWSMPNEYVRVYEHRLVARAADHEHVHHINGVKTDNRRENLQILTPSHHASIHSVSTVDWPAAEQFYDSGRTTREIAATFGVDPSTVSRGLRRIGCRMRSGFVGEANGNAKLSDEQRQTIRRRRANGDRCVDLAAEFNVSRQTIRNVCK